MSTSSSPAATAAVLAPITKVTHPRSHHQMQSSLFPSLFSPRPPPFTLNLRNFGFCSLVSSSTSRPFSLPRCRLNSFEEEVEEKEFLSGGEEYETDGEFYGIEEDVEFFEEEARIAVREYTVSLSRELGTSEDGMDDLKTHGVKLQKGSRGNIGQVVFF